jgi:hypothetical protein
MGLDTVSNKTIVKSPLVVPLPSGLSTGVNIDSTRLSNHYRAQTSPVSPTLKPKFQHHESQQTIPTGSAPTGRLENLKNLIGKAPSSLKHSNLSAFNPRSSNMPRLNRYLRLTTIFIARNFYWLKWVIIIGVASFVIFVALPVVLI